MVLFEITFPKLTASALGRYNMTNTIIATGKRFQAPMLFNSTVTRISYNFSEPVPGREISDHRTSTCGCNGNPAPSASPSLLPSTIPTSQNNCVAKLTVVLKQLPIKDQDCSASMYLYK